MLEALVAGGAEGLLLLEDSATCEGRGLLRAFVSAAVQRAERVLVLLLEASREQFGAGLSPEVTERLQFRDAFADPLGWLGGGEGEPPDLGGLLWGPPPKGPPPPPPETLVLDSLSWLLLRLPPPRLGPALGALLGGGGTAGPPPRRVLALLHRDLHPPGVLRALGGGWGGALGPTRIQIVGGGARGVTVMEPPRGGRLKPPHSELFALGPGPSLRSLGVPPAPPPQEEGGGRGGGGATAPPPFGAPPTFRLRLSAAEEGARAALPPPYLLSPPRRAALLRGGPDPCDPPEDPEDPDGDLDV